MDRSQVIAQAAAQLRAQFTASLGAASRAAPGAAPSATLVLAPDEIDLRGLALMRRICAAATLELYVDTTGGMLGGADARLQLWDWEQPAAGGCIWYSATMDAHERAFALAHELGHYALHRGEGVALHDACGPRQLDSQEDTGDLAATGPVEDYSPRARREREANAFAAELLMPRGETRRRFLADPQCDVARLASHFGVALRLAQRRLIDAVLSADRFAQASATATPEPAPPHDDQRRARAATLLARLDDSQRAAATAEGPALVVAGPGTGKTATLIGRVAYLTEIMRVQPERVLALTFSNKAAGEIRDRLVAEGLRGERLPVMTIHAFAAMLLRGYASRVPHAADEPALTNDFRLLDEADNRLLLEELLPQLGLRYYRSIYHPTAHLGELASDFSQARNMLLTPADYRALVDAMPIAPAPTEQPIVATVAVGAFGAGAKRAKKPAKTAARSLSPGTFTVKAVAKAWERACAYGVWDRALRQRGLVDFGGLIMRAVELLRADETARFEIRRNLPHILVDEFQDTNRAAAELLLLLGGEVGGGVWVVGDPHQAIYRWRGADSQNLARLVTHYPRLHIHTLGACYRSTPDLVRLGVTLATQMNVATTTPGADVSLPSETSDARQVPTALDTRGGASPGQATALSALTASALSAVRAPVAAPAVARAEGLPSAEDEAATLALAIGRQCARGYPYRDQAILCRTGAQVNAISHALTSAGVPVAEAGDFFAREEVKDALAFVALAAGPDGGGLLRGATLLAALGQPEVAPADLAQVTRIFAEAGWPLPIALTIPANLDAAGVAPLAQRSLMALGAAALAVHHDYARQGMGAALAQFLLRPGGYAWSLARQADAPDAPDERARVKLSALGALARLALGFDTRWRNEPGFRAQLLRGVRRASGRGAAAPTLPDAREGAPSADVVTDGLISSLAEPPEGEAWGATAPADGAPISGMFGRVSGDASGDASPELSAEWAPIARCFLRYLSVLREAKTDIPVAAGQDDAVAVMTIHGSKGLEFPIVYLPALADGKFPTQQRGAREVNPAGFSVLDLPGEREHEDRCLFYVAITRARDQVVFSYGGANAKRSPLLALLDADPGYANAPAPLDAATQTGERATLSARLAATPAFAADGDATPQDDEYPNAGVNTADEPLSASPSVKPEYTLHELEAYLECPLRFRYAAQYHLRAAGEQATLGFHRFVRGGLADLGALRERRPDATWAEAEAHVQARWLTDGPRGLPHDDMYKRYGDGILKRQWGELASGAPTTQRTTARQELHAELRQAVVKVTADRVIEDGGEPGAAPRRVTLERLHISGPAAKDQDDLALLLYYIAYRQRQPEVEPRVTLRYLGASLADVDTMSGQGDAIGESNESSVLADAAEQSSLLDVTAKVASDGRHYLDPAHKRSRLDKLDRAAQGIAAGRFPARPSEQRCAACPYFTICPSDPAQGQGL